MALDSEEEPADLGLPAHTPEDPPIVGHLTPSPNTGNDYMAFSVLTPVAGTRGRPHLRNSPVRARGPRLTARDWSYLPGRRNRRRRRNLNRKISYLDEGEIDDC